MRIEGWHVDGFGALHDVEIGDLQPGVTVLLGQNEAGKSTLLAFLRAMLFGFPDKRTRENQYPPVAGGRHGGTLALRDGDSVWTVHRYADKRAAVGVQGSDGRAGDEADLRRLLAGVDATLFKSVYAFSLDELQRFATLDAEGVRERIFSVGISGAGLSARGVLKQLAEEEAQLLKQRAGQARINDRVRVIARLRDETRQAEHAARTYPDHVAREDELSRRVSELDATLKALAAARRRFELLSGLRPEWEELDRSARLLAELPEPSDPRQPAAVEDLRQRLLVLRSREEGLDEKRASATTARRELDRHLQRLGSDWTADRLSAVDDSLLARDAIRDWGRTLDAADEAVGTATLREQARRESCTELESDHRRCSLELPSELPPSAADLDQREAALRGLRTQVRDLQMAELRASPTIKQPRFAAWHGALLAALALVAVAAVARVSGAPQLSLGLAVGAVVLLLVALAAWLLARRAGIGGDSGADALARMRAQVAADSRRCGLNKSPSDVELSTLEMRLAATRAQRITCDGSEAQIRQIEAKLATMRGQIERAATETVAARDGAEDKRAAWTRWLAARDLPPLSPEGALELFDEVHQARAAHQTLTQAEAEMNRIEAERAAWSERARDVLAGSLPESAVQASPDLEAALARLGRDFDERQAALERKAGCEHRLHAGLSALADPENALDELGSGEPAYWQTEIARLAVEIDETEAARTSAIEARRDAQRAREELEESADVPRLQAALESSRAELAVAVHDYRVVRTASGLVQTTLEGYVRDRQPGVLDRASAAFAAVTGGRFRAIVQEAAAETDAIVVEQWDGARLTPDQLSRGTCEQLYLAIRLALVEEFAERGQELPLIMDDCLVNFDPERAAAMARLIAASATRGQCLYFTCHPSTAQLFQDDPRSPARLIRLPARGGSTHPC